jgi:ADP-ribose pyrophosphatase
MSEIKKVSSDVVHKNPWWEYKRDSIVHANGAVGEYYYAESPGNVIIIPVLDDGRLVLVREYRYLNEKYGVQFPGGGIHNDEPVLEAAKRELLEETGYTTENLIKLGVFEPSVGMIKDMSHIFIANELVLLQEPKVESFEQTEVMLRRVDEFEDMIKRGEIWSGQTLAAWALGKDLILNNFTS